MQLKSNLNFTLFWKIQDGDLLQNAPIKGKINCYTYNLWTAKIILKEVVVIKQSHINLNLNVHPYDQRRNFTCNHKVVFGSWFLYVDFC